MDDNKVPKADRHIAIHPYGLRLLLGIATATSSDYVTIKALVQGDIDTWLGFQWHMSTNLATTGDTTRCFAWHRDAIKVGMTEEPFGRIEQLPEMNYSWQVFFEMRFGAVRMEEAGVEEMPITTSGS